MKSRIIFLLSALAALFLPLAYAENNPAQASVQAAPATGAPARGAFYRIRRSDRTAYLYGTIHVGMPAFFPLDAQVTRALSSATRLALELDVRDSAPFQEALQKHGVYAGGDTLDRHLSPDSLLMLQQALQRYDIPYEQVMHLKPWLATNLLLGTDLERNGYQRQNGVEFFLLANAWTKPVLELESAEYQMSLYDALSDAEQEQYLRENLAELEGGATLKKVRALIDAWAAANSDAMELLFRESLAEKTLSSEFTHRVLLDKRNPEMASKIEAMLEPGETTFVGVGLLHLIGETGVPQLLRARGYEVEKLY